MNNPGSESDVGVDYEHKVVRVIRGREETAKATEQNNGWEFVSENRGLVRSELTFRRPRPDPPAFLGAITSAAKSVVSTFNRQPTRTKLIIVAAAVLAVLVPILIDSTSSDDPQRQPGTKASAKATDAATTTAATTGPTPAPIVDTSVDELLDRLNAADVEVGDRFRLTGELFEQDIWGTGASGDFAVYLTAKAGDDDLLVFVSEEDAETWQDGTMVEMVVKVGRATIDGETSDGWLRAESVKVISGETSKEAKAEAAEVKRVKALAKEAKAMNAAVDAEMITGVERGYAAHQIHVNLGTVVASGSQLQAQTMVQTINTRLVEVDYANHPETPIFTYFLAGQEVAQNRYILDPEEVKFSGVLQD